MKTECVTNLQVSKTKRKQSDADEFNGTSGHELEDDGTEDSRREETTRSRQETYWDCKEKRSQQGKSSTSDSVTRADRGVTHLRTVKRRKQCAATVDSGDTWQGRALKWETGSKGREREREKGKRAKVGGELETKRGARGLLNMSECDEPERLVVQCANSIVGLLGKQ